MIPPMQWKQTRHTLTFILWSVMFLYTAIFFFRLTYGGYDFKAYIGAVESRLGGGSYYNRVGVPEYLYPPFLAQVLTPFVQVFGAEMVKTLWFALLVGSLLFSAWRLSGAIPHPQRERFWLSLALFYPLWECLQFGQVAMVLLALIVGAWWQEKQDRRFLSGGLIAVAAWIKVFPALIGLYWLMRRDWKALRGLLMVGVGLALAQWLLAGTAEIQRFLDTLLTLGGSGQTDRMFRTHSLLGEMMRLFQDLSRTQPLLVDDTLFFVARWSLMAGMLGATAFAAWRSRESESQADLAFGAVVALSLLLSSTLWLSGMPPLVLTYALMLRSERPRAALIVRLSFILISLIYPYHILNTETETLAQIPQAFGFLGVTLAWGWSVWASGYSIEKD